MPFPDFELQPRGPYLFEHWKVRSRVVTPFGEFVVEARAPLGDTAPPDARTIDQARALMDFVASHPYLVLDTIFEDYEAKSEDTDWMEELGVEVGLDREGIVPLLDALSLVVDRDGSEPTIYVIPEWDREHALYLAVREGRVVFQR